MVRIFAPTATSDNSTWTLVGAADVHLCVDDPTASSDDATTYVQADFDAATFTVDLSSIDPVPSVAAGHTIRVRMRNAGGVAIDTGEIVVSLLDAGGPLYASPKTQVDNAGWANYSFDLGLVSPLSDYSALRIQVDDAGIALDKRLRITSVEFEIPSEVAIDGTAAGSSSTAATLVGIGSAVGSAAGTSSTTAACVGTGLLTGSSAGLSQAAASLLGVALITGSADGSSSTSATLTPFTFIEGSAAGSSSTAATLVGLGLIAGSSAGLSTVVATIIDASGLGPFEIISNTVRLRFASLVASPLALVTVYDNAPTAVPDSAAWCRLEVRMGQCEQIAIGPNASNLYRKSGEVVAAVYTPLGQGDGAALSIASTIVSALRGVTSNETIFEAPRVEAGYRDGTRWRVDVRMPFRSDFSLERVAGAAPSSLTLEDAASVVRTRFETEVETGLSITMRYDGEDGAIPAPTATWCRLAIVHGASEAVERVGAQTRFRTVGIAYAYLFVPLENGDQSALRLSDQLARAFRSVSDRGVTFKTPIASGTQRAGPWWQVKVACPFHWDEIA